MKVLVRWRRALVGFAFAAIGCTDGIGAPEARQGLPELPKKGGYTLVPIDSPNVTLGAYAIVHLAGLTNDGQVFGRFSSSAGSGLFRWRNGAFTMYPAAPAFSATRFNERGDLVGSVGPNQPVVWYAEAPTPTRIFAFDTAVVAVDVNHRGDVLLSATREFQPGASLWRAGASTPVGSGSAISASALTDSGLVWVTSRGTLVDSSWFAASALDPGAAFAPACLVHPARRFIAVDRRTPRVLSALTYTDTVLYFTDDGVQCRNLSSVMPEFVPTRLLERGFILGSLAQTSSAGYSYRVLAISNGREAVRISDLLPAPAADWGIDAPISMNASGMILFSARKLTGYGQGKTGLVLLVP